MKSEVTAVVSCMVEGDLPFAAEGLRSVERQSHACEIIVLLSERTAGFQDVVKAMGIAARCEVIPLSPAGVTRNLGVKFASTEWIAFLDIDDIWRPCKIERQLKYAAKHGCWALGTRHILMWGDQVPFFYGFARTMPLTSSWLVKRDFLVQEPFLDVKEFEDAELWRRFNRRRPTRTMLDYLIHYRVRASSYSSNFSNPKRNKEWFARASRNTVARCFFLATSRAVSWCYWPKYPAPA